MWFFDLAEWATIEKNPYVGKRRKNQERTENENERKNNNVNNNKNKNWTETEKEKTMWNNWLYGENENA